MFIILSDASLTNKEQQKRNKFPETAKTQKLINMPTTRDCDQTYYIRSKKAICKYYSPH